MTEFLSTGSTAFLASVHTGTGLASLIATLLGASLVIAASFARTMTPLRALALGSNSLFLIGAVLAPNVAGVALYCVLIPLNTYRLVEIVRLSRQVDVASAEGNMTGVWLKPYMKVSRLRAGSLLFERGDPANQLYLLAEGTIDLVEIAQKIPAGQLFGEIAYFSPDRRRTMTAHCATDCTVLSINERTFKQLYFQRPNFAFQIARLIASRLGADVARLEEKLARLELERATSPGGDGVLPAHQRLADEQSGCA